MIIMPAPNEYMVALGHDMLDHEDSNQEHLQSESTPTFTKKKGIWSGLKHMFHQRQRTPSRNRNERRQFSTDLSSLSYSCLGQARQDEEEMYGINSQQRSRLSRNLSMSHESVFQMEPLPSQSSEEQLITPRTSSSTALPMMMHTELQAVLRQRQSRSRNFSKQSNDFTDDEDLGLPKSLQNSPGDFSDDLVVSSVLRSSGPWGASRHHSSCSDNSLLSLDSYDNKVDNETRESMYYRDKSPGDVRNRSVSPGDRLISRYSGDGKLSHQAARHKMAIRPKRNHAVKQHRRLQQLEEVHETQDEIIFPSNQSKDLNKSSIPVSNVYTSKSMYPESANNMHYKSEEENSDLTLEEMKTKSKSLDISFRAAAPSSSTLKEMSKDANKSKTKSKAKVEQEGSFLSRLFGSKRHKMKTSISKKDLDDKAFKPKSQGHKPQASESSISAHTVESNLYKQGYYHPSDTMADANKLSPPKYKPSVKQKPPPPPPDSVPPSVRKCEEFSSGVNEIKDMQAGQRSVPKSQSFRQNEGLIMSQDEPEYPSLPAQVSHADVILKKNKSMSSVLSVEASHQKFRSSIENWSFANEGLKKSIGSLADKPIITSQSNESLKTITSLLEEPDLLEHTSILDERVVQLGNNHNSENISLAFTDENSFISNEINSPLTNRGSVMEDGFLMEQVHKNVITNVIIDDFQPLNDTEKYIFESVTESLPAKENLCNIKDSQQDTLEDFHIKLKSSPLTSGYCEGDTCNMADQMGLYPCNRTHDDGLVLSDEGNQEEKNVCVPHESKNNDENKGSDFAPRYQEEEVEKLIQLADNSGDLKLEQPENFSPTNIDNNQASLDIADSDLDLSLSSLEVFHTPKSLNLSQMSFFTATEKSNHEEKKNEESPDSEKECQAEEPQEALSKQPETSVDLLKTSMGNSSGIEMKSQILSHTPSLTKPQKPQRLQLDTSTSETMQQSEPGGSNNTLNTQEVILDMNSSQSNVTHDMGFNPIVIEIADNTNIDKEFVTKQETGETELEENTKNDHTKSKLIENSTQKILIESKKPEISPKPVPAPRHFFLKKTCIVNQNDDPNRSPKLEDGETTELINVFARRSKSTTVLGLENPEKNGDESNLKEVESDKSSDSNDAVINVKERAKSFSGIQNYAYGPKPFRPSSIAHEIRMTKPMNIPPKPKLAQKPVPAPRQFRSISNTDVLATKDIQQKKVTKSASHLQETEQKVSVNETKSKTTLENVTSVANITKGEVAIEESKPSIRTDDTVIQKPTAKDENLPTHLDKNNMEEIQVKKIVNNFQKSKSPEKPIRKFPPVRVVQSEDILGSLPLNDLATKDDTSRNVMSIVTKLNAMSTTAVMQ